MCWACSNHISIITTCNLPRDCTAALTLGELKASLPPFLSSPSSLPPLPSPPLSLPPSLPPLSRQLPWLLATASNTWGLLILALLLGYGLVEVPRSLLNASRRNYTLKHCYFMAAKLYMDMAEADDKLKEIMDVSLYKAHSIS